jgi:hypothetical protein
VRDTDAVRRARKREQVLQKHSENILALLVQNCKLCTCTRYLHALLRGAPSVRDTDAARGVLWRKCEQVQYSN